ncbi:helix-turn-helix domain-containing protein [Nitrosococcus wardiae]|nr:helix-turn-helix transcriptional regulator [Nitrosococcus wardiae]
MASSISERIKIARRKAKLTQQDLATYVGVSRAAVAQWESGETKGLKPENLIFTAEKLNVSVKWLAIGKGPMYGEAPADFPDHALQLARLISQAPPEKVKAILMLLGVNENAIHIRPPFRETPSSEPDQNAKEGKKDRRSGKDRRQNVHEVDFERRSGLDRRDDEGVILGPGESLEDIFGEEDGQQNKNNDFE